MNLSTLDLNLFVVLHVVLEERSATRAARRLHVTQSAVSNAIARLRSVLADPLVVRSGRGLAPTPRAEELRPFVAQAIAQLQAAVDRGAAFDPRGSERSFTLSLSDNYQTSEAARIADAFGRKMPRASLRLVSNDYLVATNGLATGDVDAAFAPSALQAPGVRARPIFEEQACMVVRRDHPRVRGKLTPKLFNELPHIDIEVVLGRVGVGGRMAEQHWRREGLERKVAITVPYFTTAAMIAAQTDCIAGLPGRVAEVMCRCLPLKVVATTFPLPKMGMSLVWHERTDADPGGRYFRDLVVEATGGAPDALSAPGRAAGPQRRAPPAPPASPGVVRSPPRSIARRPPRA
jgi:DNA-binding transcriptional LysR family regulator